MAESVFNLDTDLTAEQQKMEVEFKKRMEAAMDQDDHAAVQQLARQREMFRSDPDKHVPPRSVGSKVEEFAAEGAESVRNYWRGFDPTGVLGEQSQQQPRSGYGVAGNLTGALAANPLDLFKKPPMQAVQAGVEGFTAPAENVEERMGNAATGIGASFGLNAVGGLANKSFNMNANNPNTPGAVRFAKEEGLPGPFADDYTNNPLAKLAGWFTDEPLLVGRYGQVDRLNKVEKHARNLAESKQATIGLSDSVKKQYDADWGKSRKMYDDLWDEHPSILPDESMMIKMDGIQGQMQNVMEFLPAKVRGNVEKLVMAKPRTLRDWHEVRSLLREHSTSMQTKMTPGRRYLTDAVEALDDMMYSSLSPTGQKALRAADRNYARTIPKYTEQKALREAIDEGNSKGVIELLGAGDRFDAEKVWRSLDNEGQASAQALIHKEAVQAGTDPQGVFSPQQYAKYWEDLGDSTGVVFSKAEQDSIDGMKKLHAMTSNAESGGSGWMGSRAISNYATMAGLTGAASAAGAGLFTPTQFAVGLGSTAAITFLMRSQAGAKFLRGLGKVQSSAEAAKLMYQLGKVVSRNPELAQQAGIPAEQIGEYIKGLDAPGAYEEYVKGFEPIYQTMEARQYEHLQNEAQRTQ